MEEETKIKLQELMLALEKITGTIKELKIEKERLYDEFKGHLPCVKIMKIVR